MLNDAMQIVLQFRVFLIAAIIVALAMEIALLFGTKHFGWQRKNLWIYRFFFGLTRPQCCFLAASWLWLLFTATSALFVVDMQLCHLAMLLLLSAAKFTAWKRMQMLLRDLFNSVLLFAAMMAENLLLSAGDTFSVSDFHHSGTSDCFHHSVCALLYPSRYVSSCEGSGDEPAGGRRETAA